MIVFESAFHDAIWAFEKLCPDVPVKIVFGTGLPEGADAAVQKCGDELLVFLDAQLTLRAAVDRLVRCLVGIMCAGETNPEADAYDRAMGAFLPLFDQRGRLRTQPAANEVPT